MKTNNYLFLSILLFSFVAFSQVQNNCTTTNFLTKRDSNGNLICSNIFEDLSGFHFGSTTNPFFVYHYNNTILQNSSSVNIFSWYINNNKPSSSQIWMVGSTTASGGYGASNGFSILEGGGSYQTRFFIHDGTGNVGIGTTTIPTNYKLAVAGKIIAEELKVQLQGSWPDYVFAPDYNLPTLLEVEKQIKEKGHLENIPSACEVQENGIEVGEMNRLLLEKVEELTLYIIDLNKKMETQSIKINELEEKVKNN